MSPEEFRSLLREQPFRPLRLHRGGGRTIEVRRPEMATAGGELAAVGEPLPDGRDRLRVVSLININEVEVLPAQSA